MTHMNMVNTVPEAKYHKSAHKQLVEQAEQYIFTA